MTTNNKFYLFQSRVLSHVVFWLLYFVFFSLIWAEPGRYYESFFLEFSLLPIRISAVYLTIYILIPRSLLNKKYAVFGFQYAGLIVAAGLLQRAIIFFFYESNELLDWAQLLRPDLILRAMILINSTVVFIGAYKILDYYYLEKTKNAEEEKPTIDIRSDKRVFRVAPKDISYIEGLGNYVTYHLENDKKLISYKSMKAALEGLPGYFVRIHKSYIVNTRKITSYSNENVELDGKLLPASKPIDQLLKSVN